MTQRRYQRYPLRLWVETRVGKRVSRLATEDVSCDGVFLRTDSPPPLRQLVGMRFRLPPDDDFEAYGMVIHVARPGASAKRVPGMGVQLYGLDSNGRRRWNDFVRRAANCEIPASAESADDDAVTFLDDAEELPEPIRRQSQRFAVQLEVRLLCHAGLEVMLTRDVSRGGMFLSTNQSLAVGEELTLQVIHPTNRELFALEAVVRHVVQEPYLQGVGVEFVTLEDRLDRFINFVYSGSEMDPSDPDGPLRALESGGPDDPVLAD